MYEELEKFISIERIKKYLNTTNDDKQKALDLYKTNIKHSSKMYMLLSCFEVFLRNIINNNLLKNDKNWLLNLNKLHIKILNDFKKYQTLSKNNFSVEEKENFFNIQNSFIEKAKNDLLKENKQITNSNIISKLSFGFWENLLNKNYENFIWNKHLKNVFDINRGFLQKEINYFRKIRNRTAHNEYILNYDLNDIKNRIYRIFEFVNVNLNIFIETMSQDL